jgi:hypothetical protein
VLLCLFSKIRYNTISTITDMYPMAVKEIDNTNLLPLQLALSSWYPNSVIKRIIDLYPEGFMYPDVNGAFPIHHLVHGHMCHFNQSSLGTHVI